MTNLTYKDVLKHEKKFNLAPAFVLERFAKKNSNLVSKFESQVYKHLGKMSDSQKEQAMNILNTDVDILQGLLNEAYQHNNKKQFKILGNPEYKPFLEKNIAELKKIIE